MKAKTQFKKGQIPWNKGKIFPRKINPECIYCKMPITERNIYPHDLKDSRYICKDCRREQRRIDLKKFRASRENIDISKFNKKCKDCGISLTNENTFLCQRKSGNYICKTCSKERRKKWGLRRLKNPEEIKDIETLNKVCLRCGIKLTKENIFPCFIRDCEYTCKKCSQIKAKAWRQKNSEKYNEYCRNLYRSHIIKRRRDANLRMRKLKEEAVISMGGKCQKCGYDKCFGALEFHHLDKSVKEKVRLRANEDYQKIIQYGKEGKVKLLCNRCHREEEWEDI